MSDFNTENGVKLDRVVMPIVLLMGHPDLTWLQREACGDAIKETLKQYGVIMTEVEALGQERPVKRGR